MASKRRKLFRPKPLKPVRARLSNEASRDGARVRAVIKKSDPVRVWKTFA